MKPLDSFFFSEETGAPFCHCSGCRLPLLEIDRPWLVTKEFHAAECIEEYAICENCRNLLTDRIPEPTKHRIRQFLESEIDWDAQIEKWLGGDDRLAACICCQTGREEATGFTISAAFDSSGHLVEGPLPLLMCRPCCDRFHSLLCDDGRRIWNEFCQQHLRSGEGGSGPLML